MKITLYTILCLTALECCPALSQPAPAPTPPSPPPLPGASPSGSFSSRLQNIIQKASEPSPPPVLTKFNLDFSGGTPKDLVLAIEKAMGRPLNAIIPNEDADTQLPALKMSDVNVDQLFRALRVASVKLEVYPSEGYNTYRSYSTSYSFKTEGTPSDNSIWTFNVEKPHVTPQPPPPKTCRFYSLTPYIDRGVSVDDITTAIETGWKMLGDTSRPTISFHKDTKLLIAVGETRKLETIDAVLKALEGDKESPLSPPRGAPSATPRAGVPGKAKKAN